MSTAVEDWLGEKGLRYDDNEELIMDMNVYANRVGIPRDSIYRYIHPDPKKRKLLGDGSRGKAKIMTNDDVGFVGQALARLDRGNDGASLKEALDILQELKPKITRTAARDQLRKVVLPENARDNVLKSKPQKVQATTSDRTNINVAQQYRWHTLVDSEYDRLRDLNTGRCKKSNLRFEQVLHHFIVGLDEMCLMSDAHGNLQVVAAADKKKHEKLLQDCRVSITIVRTGTVGGTTGPTIFLLKGTKRKHAFSDAFLERHGMAKGSTIIMTENAYMTDEAWLKASRAIVEGYRHLPYVKENIDWWLLELLDGFKSHENNLKAHELRAKKKVRSTKEESNSSHANQGYDQLTAKNDKKIAAESLYDQRKGKKIKQGRLALISMTLC